MGPDGLYPCVLKTLAPVIASTLQITFQKSLDTGKVPAVWVCIGLCTHFTIPPFIILAVIVQNFTQVHLVALFEKWVQNRHGVLLHCVKFSLARTWRGFITEKLDQNPR